MTLWRCAKDPLLLGLSWALLLGAGLLGCGGADTKQESTTPQAAIQQTASAASSNSGATASASEGEAGTATAAVPALEPAAAPPSGGPPPTELVRAALEAVRRGRYEEAIRGAKVALQRDEKYVPAMVVMARAYYHLNKLEFAESICEIALGINPNTGECYNLKGFIALKHEDAPLALQQFEKATKAQPNFGPAWLNLGAQYLEVKNFTAAITALERAVELMPNRAEAHLNLGSAYRGEGQVVKAQQSYSKALALRPNYPAAYFNLGLLFLDAEAYPGMDKLQQLSAAVSYFNKYKQQAPILSKDDPVDSYILEAQKANEREVKAREREAKKKAREAAKAAEAAAKAAAGGKAGATEAKPAEAKPASDSKKK